MSGYWLYLHNTLAFSDWLMVLLIGTGMAESMMLLMSLNHMINKAAMENCWSEVDVTAPCGRRSKVQNPDM
jgi:hypothetical protein